MNSKRFDIALNGYLPSLLSGLTSDGINVNKYLKNSYLQKLDLYNPDHYIPNILLESILVEIKHDLGLDSLSKDLRRHFQATKMGRFSKHIYQSPSFLTFLEEVIKYQKYIRSNYSGNLQIFGTISQFSVRIDEKPSKGKLICEEIDMLRILDAFMLVGGKNFAPIELGITANSSYNIESVLPKGNYKLNLNQHASWIKFETTLLSKKIPGLLEKSAPIESNLGFGATTFKIERLINSFKDGTVPRLEEIAQMLDLSSRTLERYLKFEGTNFMQLKQKYLTQKSIELLENPKLSINEISEKLDYSYSQNFVRSFKLWTGTTPEQYRLMSN